MSDIFFVALGGSIGAVSRYLIGNFALNKLGANFPYGTLIANLLGCFIIGLFMTAMIEKMTINPAWRLLISVGFLGGLTTFSSFSYESIKLLYEAQYLLAIYNIGINLIFGFLATISGICLAKIIF